MFSFPSFPQLSQGTIAHNVPAVTDCTSPPYKALRSKAVGWYVGERGVGASAATDLAD